MKLTIYKGQYGYQTIVSNKEKTLKEYMNVRFRKDKEPKQQDKLGIEVNDGFFSCYSTKKGETKVELVVMDYKISTLFEKKKEEYFDEQQYQKERESQTIVTMEDLPF